MRFFLPVTGFALSGRQNKHGHSLSADFLPVKPPVQNANRAGEGRILDLFYLGFGGHLCIESA